ncbi:MAG: cellulase family glycosylhydrolase [Armatimonadetes bacterium]|nr:cellulase family glycosylhydrolase [Armatimonadota bacterium]
MNSFKSLSLLASAMFFSSLASVSYGQGNPPGDPPGETELNELSCTDPIPKYLRYGVNLDGVYQADWAYMLGRPCYDERRLDDLLIEADFVKLRLAGFEHVRIPISPVAFGVHDQTGKVEPSFIFKREASDPSFSPGNWPVGYHINAQENFEALAADIIAAQAQGLDVILDCHPWLVSQAHYDYEWKGGAGTTKPPSGTFLENFCTDGPMPIPITQNHPLPKFWSSFLAELRIHLDVLENPLCGGNVFQGIHFEVLNEPMVNFWGQISETQYGPRYSEGASNTSLDPAIDRQWKFDQLANWKAIQAQAIKAIYTEVDPEGNRIIVSTLTNLVDSFGEQKRQPLVPGTPTYQFTPYSPSEMTAIGCPESYSRRLIYAYHPYLPFKYTHKEPIGGIAPEYLKKRDYGDNFVAPHTSFFYRDNILESENSSTRTKAMPYMFDWVGSYDNPAIIATEFGVIKRDGDPYAEPDPVPTNPTTLDVDDWQRYKWHYDLRTLMEAHNSAWTVFGYTSTWGVTGRFVYLERFKLNENPIYHRSITRNGGGVIHPMMIQALFSDTRPSDGNDD